MKYHGYIIKIVPEDLGEENPRDNRGYEIYKGEEYINVALTLSTAKDYIDSGCDERYL